MTWTILLHLVTYAAIIVFVAVVAFRFIKVQSMPLHVRWELYPVGHEPGRKAQYGGSYFENVDWWTKPRETSTLNELKAMIPEMLFLAALFEHNRKLWWRSFPFHFGLYILIATMALLLLGTLIEIAGGSSVGLISSLTWIFAIVGLALATVGTISLLSWRLFDEEIKNYTSPADIFNLAFFLVVLLLGWIVVGAVDPTFSMTRSFVQNLITLNVSAPVGSTILGIEILLVGLLCAYIPMTHMSHFFLKWFTWHKIRWDDEPNVRGGKIEKKIMEQVTYPVSWSAPHINADNKKNWVDIALEGPIAHDKEEKN